MITPKAMYFKKYNDLINEHIEEKKCYHHGKEMVFLRKLLFGIVSYGSECCVMGLSCVSVQTLKNHKRTEPS